METVTVQNFDDGATLISINRPERRNAISRQVALDLQAAFAEFDRSEQRVAVLTGAGDDAFSAGADVKDLPELWRAIPTVGIATEKPIIAAVAGYCIGGALVMAMMTDLLVAAENAKFSYPEAKLGFTGGMIAGLVTRIPHKIAMEIMLLGRAVDAQRAYAVGLANEVVPTGQQVERALELARELAAFSPVVLKTIKRFVTATLPRGPSESFGVAARDLAFVRESADGREGAAAAREKRKPKFTGR
jgi:enoyl-CoA hydratase